MSLLENLPHTVEVQERTTTLDDYGGMIETWATVSGKSAVSSWVQPAGDAEVSLFEKRGQRVSHKIYFVADPGINETMRIIYGGKVFTFRSLSQPDAGTGILWRAMVDEQTNRDMVA